MYRVDTLLAAASLKIIDNKIQIHAILFNFVDFIYYPCKLCDVYVDRRI